MILTAIGPARAADDQGQDRTVDLLARTIFHEASGEGRLGMIAVGWVVLNRTRDPSFPRSVADVVQERHGRACQWSWACATQREPHGTSWQRAQTIAAMMLKDPPPDPTNGAVWLQHAQASEPRWGFTVYKTARIGNHAFYGRNPVGDLDVATR
ncbi:cell wall hydrolase [Arboricoccus pini]|uniref:cell wall hydrolase n=1 Tax=Arboricoccus pini TaxID=1963835 RepID=UPI0013FE1F4D|nr:cell wall hydrolase [Arboricoccus pini]